MPKRLLIALSLLALWGCTWSGAASTLPTPLPTGFIPTAIALTARALASPTPTAPPVSPSPRPSPTPPISPTATPYPLILPTLTPTAPPPLDTTGEGYAPVQILYPGEGSVVRSPLTVRFAVQARYADILRVELLGEDGALRYRRVYRLDEDQPAHNLLFFSEDIPFEIHHEAEVGRLQISAWDKQGLPLFQNAVTLTLLREGPPQINHTTAEYSPIRFQSPQPFQTVRGGQLHVAGKALPVSQVVEVLVMDYHGKTLIYQTAALSTPTEDGYARFEVDIPYTIEKQLWVRLVVREEAQLPEGTLYLNSIPLTLAP